MCELGWINSHLTAFMATDFIFASNNMLGRNKYNIIQVLYLIAYLFLKCIAAIYNFVIILVAIIFVFWLLFLGQIFIQANSH